MTDVTKTDPFGPHGFIETEVNGVFIRLTRTVDGGYTRRVWTGTNVFDGLGAGHHDLTLAARECSGIRARLIAGERARDIEADFQGRNNAVLAEVAQVLAEAPAPTNLAAFRQASTSTGAPTTAPLQQVLTTADRDGFITRGRTGGSSTQLIALRKRGLVELVYGVQRNQRAIVGARLTNSGLKAAA